MVNYPTLLPALLSPAGRMVTKRGLSFGADEVGRWEAEGGATVPAPLSRSVAQIVDDAVRALPGQPAGQEVAEMPAAVPGCRRINGLDINPSTPCCALRCPSLQATGQLRPPAACHVDHDASGQVSGRQCQERRRHAYTTPLRSVGFRRCAMPLGSVIEPVRQAHHPICLSGPGSPAH